MLYNSGIIGKLSKHRLSFHKKSDDRSSKCNLFHTGSESDLIYGAIYEIHPEHKSVLDRFEGEGFGYTNNQIKIQHQDQEHDCFTYIAQQSHITDDLRPYHWYKELVVLGARHLQFPESYILSIESVVSMEDPNEQRRKERAILIEKVINYR